jgi:nucleoside-diphosphate-sugar epimerase
MKHLYAGRKVAVTGASGFIGSHLVRRLVEDGAEVLAIARSANRAASLAAVRTQIRFVTADLSDSSATAVLFRNFKPEKVFHMAAHPDRAESFQQMRDCLRHNTEAVINLLEISQEAGVETFVFCDSTKDFGNCGLPYSEELGDKPVCSYAIAKSAAWHLCKLYATLYDRVNVVGVRPTLVYGPGQNGNLISHLNSCVEQGRPIRVQGGWQTRDPLYIDDAVDAFLCCGVSNVARGHAVPIGGGHEMTVMEICETVLRHLGVSRCIEADSGSLRPTEIYRSVCANVEAGKLLGWRPRFTFEQGLARTFSTYTGADHSIAARAAAS